MLRRRAGIPLECLERGCTTRYGLDVRIVLPVHAVGELTRGHGGYPVAGSACTCARRHVVLEGIVAVGNEEDGGVDRVSSVLEKFGPFKSFRRENSWRFSGVVLIVEGGPRIDSDVSPQGIVRLHPVGKEVSVSYRFETYVPFKEHVLGPPQFIPACHGIPDRTVFHEGVGWR